MTEKRFTTDNGSNEDVCLVDNIMGVEYEDNFEDIVKVLNELDDIRIELQEENEQLKEKWKEQRHEDINELSVIAMKYKALENENEQLKKDLKLIKELKNCDVNEMLELQEENEQFKQLNIPIDEIEDTVKDWKGRTVGVYYNDREI